VDEMAFHAGVVQGPAPGVHADHVRARLDQQAPRVARDRERGVAVDGRLLDEMALVLDAALREKLPRVRARRSPMAVIEDRPSHGSGP
jgi:hypothetical protein